MAANASRRFACSCFMGPLLCIGKHKQDPESNLPSRPQFLRRWTSMKTPELLLTHGYFLMEDPKELQIMKPYPPLGILYICSHLRKKGVKAEVFDSTFSSRQQLWDVLKQNPPSVLGVYANLMTRSNVVEI